MNNSKSIKHVLLFLLALLAGCRSQDEPGAKQVNERVPVTVEAIRVADLTESLDLSATSAFLTKSMVKSPVTGYIEEILINPGENVIRNQVIFKMRTRESSALRNDSLNPYAVSGLITIKANIAGMVLGVDHPRGDYLQESEQLATIAVPSSFVFIMDAPFESALFIKSFSSCEILLPDGRELKGTIYSRLPSVSAGSQTQRFILHVPEGLNLPENLIAKIRIAKRMIPHATLLSKSCILADEILKHFWVMKLINDSTAVKVPVTTGVVKDDAVEIINPVFSASDLFLASGNYGLGDTARVLVIRKKDEK